MQIEKEHSQLTSSKIDSTKEYLVSPFISKMNLFLGDVHVNIVTLSHKRAMLKLAQPYLSNAILTFIIGNC